VLFPSDVEKAHSTAYLGWGRGWLPNVKASFNLAWLTLTEEALECRWLVTRRMIVRIPRRGIREALSVEGKGGIIRLTVDGAVLGGFARFFLSGAPGGRTDEVYLNVRQPERWLRALAERPEGNSR
jgi:hypothetical protein